MQNVPFNSTEQSPVFAVAIIRLVLVNRSVVYGHHIASPCTVLWAAWFQQICFRRSVVTHKTLSIPAVYKPGQKTWFIADRPKYL